MPFPRWKLLRNRWAFEAWLKILARWDLKRGLP
jgi:hypothetical protein